MKKIMAIVPAAGIGKRIGTNSEGLPKQFWTVGDTTILGYVLRALDEHKAIDGIIIACSPSMRPVINEIIKCEQIEKVFAVVAGGKERIDSVENAFKKCPRGTTHVLIQDAVRPLLNTACIDAVIKSLGKYDGSIAARRVSSTIKRVDAGSRISGTVDRRPLWEAETPQFFTVGILMKSFSERKKLSIHFTDEAGLIEACGGRVRVCEHGTFNMKITSNSDIDLLKNLKESGMVKVGIGYDIHRLVFGRKLMLGGIEVPYEKGCLGHSDGDPLLHAVVDALLGALALGDIGELFPDTNKRYKNAPSAMFIKKVMKLVKKRGYVVAHCDNNVVLERPKLGVYKKQMQKQLAELLETSIENVSIKAKTKEGLDSEGSCFAVSVQTVVTLIKDK